MTNSHNGLNQLTAVGSTGITHDSRGNTTSDPSNGQYYSYSSENLLTGTGVTGVWNGTLTYDPLTRLYDSGAGGRTRVLHDGEQRIAEYNNAGTQTKRVVFGPSIDEPLLEYGGSGLSTRTFLHADERGSIIGASNDSAVSTGVGIYDDYGRALSFASRFAYNGQPYETVSDLLYSRARFYNPRGPRFMQTDPIGYGDGMNMYGYVGGDPVNRVDPLGLQEEEIVVTGRRFKPKQRDDTYVFRYGWTSTRYVGDNFSGGGGGGGGGGEDMADSDEQCPSVPPSRPVGLTGTVGAILRDPLGALHANEVRWAAHAAAERRFPGLSGIADARDAYRHFYWSYGMTRILGSRRALRFADAHEADYPNSSPEDRGMDTWNNWVGMQMGIRDRSSRSTAEEAAEKAMANGCLRTLR